MSAAPEVFAKRGIREAIALLRQHDVTPEQYASVRLTETWKVNGQAYPDRGAAIAEARRALSPSAGTVEVWCDFGPDADWSGYSVMVSADGVW